MDIASFAKRESMLKLRENLIAAEEERLNGKEGYTVEEVTLMMNDAIREVLGNGQQ